MYHKHQARYRKTQEMVLAELARVYGRTRYLDGVLKELTDEMWEEIEPELEEILDEYLDGQDVSIDLSRYPAIRYTLQEIERKQHWRLMEYYWIGYKVITESLAHTYRNSSKDAYAIVNQIPMWERKTIDAGIRQKAEVRITDTYITSSVLPIPWCQDGKVYSQRLYGHVANFQRKLEYVLSEGITKGRGMEWMNWAWRKLVGSSAYDTARLIKTETMAMYNRGLKDSYLEMGVEYVEIVGDAECGGICLDYVDGDPIRLDDASINVELPPYHPNCACSFVSYEEVQEVENLEDQSEGQEEE